MAEFIDYYEVLQVSPLAEAEVIDAAYKKLAQKYHPDKNPASAERMKKINNAYDILGNYEKRKVYHAQWLKEKDVGTQDTRNQSQTTTNRATYQFLIEYRLWDTPKEYARSIIFDVARTFRIVGGTNITGYKGHPRNRALPPHIALYGTAATNDIDSVIYAVGKIASQYTLVPFQINKEIINLHNKAICFTVTPSRLLDEMRWEIATELNKFCSPKSYDLERSFIFHITIANERDTHKLQSILRHLKSKKIQMFNLNTTRLTILEDGKDEIICEYDLVFHRWLNRNQAVSPQIWNETTRKEMELKWMESVSS